MAEAIKMVTVKLKNSTKEKLVHLSKVKSRSQHWLMKKAIDDYVMKEEIKEKIRGESLIRWDEASESKVVPHEEVVKWMDSWGKDNEKGKPSV
jgi:predicted transcriptional regulator